MVRFIVIVMAFLAMMFPAHGSQFLLLSEEEAPAPLGMRELCAQTPTSVACISTEPTRVSLDRFADTLLRVNEEVNVSLEVRPDPIGTDVWELDASAGECEEYVLAKLQKLVKAGVPRGALAITALQMQEGVWHGVLLVRTDQGDFVLDNMRNDIVRWDLLTGYTFRAQETADNPLLWKLVS